MKAVVMEVKEGYAAVLTDDGQFVRVKDDGYQTGMKISLKEIEKKKESEDTKRVILIKRFRTFAAAAAAVICIAVGGTLYYTPHALISMDVNPSIEMKVNRFDMVLNVGAVNEDGTELAEALISSGVKNQNYDTAVDMAFEWINERDYKADDGNVYAVLSVSGKDESYSEKVATELTEKTSSYKNVSAEVVIATNEEVAEAKELGTTPGKIHIINQLEEKEPEIEKKEWVEHPVKDIVNEINKEVPEKIETPEKKEEPERMDAPEIKEVPEKIEEPEKTEMPEKSAAPEEIKEPGEIKEPEKTEVPEQTEIPEQTGEPERTEVPEKIEVPDAMQEPEVMQEPERREGPEELHEAQAPEEPR